MTTLGLAARLAPKDHPMDDCDIQYHPHFNTSECNTCGKQWEGDVPWPDEGDCPYEEVEDRAKQLEDA